MNSIKQGYVFERKVASYFKHQGYKVHLTRKARDYGIDLIISKNGKRTGIECKHFKRGNLVGRPIIQKFDSALVHNPYGKPLDYGIVVTTSDFSSDAIGVVERINIDYNYDRLRLINGAEFKRMTANTSMWQKSLIIKIIAVGLLALIIKHFILN